MKALLNYNSNDNTHLIKIKRCSPWWWLLLLLLLPLLLLITCNKTVRFVVSDEKTNKVEANVPLSFDYSYRQIFSFYNRKWNSYQAIHLEGKTDNNGLIAFYGVKYSLFQWLFYHNETAKVFAYSECKSSGILKPVFRKLDKTPYAVKLKNKGIENGVRVKDRTNGMNLPNATVEVSWEENKSAPMTGTTDATGIAFFKEPIPLCKPITIRARCRGYYDTIVLYKNGLKINQGLQPIEVKLRPENVSLVIAAKDAKTLAPIAMVRITITDKNGRVVDERYTNTGGESGIIPGGVEFRNLDPSLFVTICGVKEGYKQKCITGMVRNLKEANQDARTLLMEPGEGSLNFWIIDNKTKQPIAGANVTLTKGGQQYSAVSADDGSVSFAELNPSDIISISASRNGYQTNSHTIQGASVSSISGTNKSLRTIPLDPIQEPEPIPPPPPVPPANTDDLQGQSGDLRINLQWFTTDDLDLYVRTPCGKQIYFLRKKAECGSSVGRLDVDANFLNERVTQTPQENVYWDDPLQGNYAVSVNHFKNRTGSMAPVPFNITIVYKGVRKDYASSVAPNRKVFVTTFVAN